jgi:thymidylate synthase
MDYVEEYLQYLMTDKKAPNELYTYGESSRNPKVFVDGRECACGVNPVEEVIDIYRKGNFGTNQGDHGDRHAFRHHPTRTLPCLRLIDTRVTDGKLHFVLLFSQLGPLGRFSSNLAAIQLLKEYMCQEIGVEDGTITPSARGSISTSTLRLRPIRPSQGREVILVTGRQPN